WRAGADESIAQKDVTALLAVSRRPASALAGALCSSVRVQTCEPGKFVLQVALAPGRPSVALSLKRPGVAVRAPLTAVPGEPGTVVLVAPPRGVVVVVVLGPPQAGGVGFVP